MDRDKIIDFLLDQTMDKDRVLFEILRNNENVAAVKEEEKCGMVHCRWNANGRCTNCVPMESCINKNFINYEEENK